MGWKCIGVGLPLLQQGSAHSSKAFLFLHKTWLLSKVSAQWIRGNVFMCICLCVGICWVMWSPLPVYSMCVSSWSCYWRSSPSSSSWMTWISSDGEVGRLVALLDSRLSVDCCLLSSLLFSSSSMTFFHTLWFSVRCWIMLQNNLRRFFLLSVAHKNKNKVCFCV